MTVPTAAAWDADNDVSPFRYGETLAISVWPRLWTMGDRTNLARSLLGFFCSRKCPGDVILRTYDLARALRDGGVPVVGGFHSPMEQECLDLLLRGRQPVVACPARSIEGMRLPAEWKKAVREGRLLLVSPFGNAQRRTTSRLAEQRNRLVGEIARTILVAHAEPNGKTAELCAELAGQGKAVWTINAAAESALRSLAVRCFEKIDAVVSGWKDE